MATHANTAQSMGIKCMKGGDLQTSAAIHFRYWGWDTSRRILGVPVVGRMATHANTAQSMGIKYMKGGGPVHQCSHIFQVFGVGYIQEFQVVLIVSTSMEKGNAC